MTCTNACYKTVALRTYVHGFDDKRLQRWSVSDSFKIHLNDNMRV